VFDAIDSIVLPGIAESVSTQKTSCARVWSAGCSSGEEPYTLEILWNHGMVSCISDLPAHRIVATDADTHMLRRAQDGKYKVSSLKQLPSTFREKAFDKVDSEFAIRHEYKENVEFLEQDIRNEMPDGPFHLLLCRNLVLTYFDEPLQQDILRKMIARIVPGGFLVVGIREQLPQAYETLLPISQGSGIYRSISS
jgi:chemotaxis protein methyltransferase CheR